MLAMKHTKINEKLEKLQSAFPKLTEENQQYVLGLAEGLKRSQEGNVEERVKANSVSTKDMENIAVSIMCFLLFFTGSFVYAQNIFTLDDAIQNTMIYFQERIPAGTKVLVLNFTSESSGLSEYVGDELTTRIVNGNVFIVVDRSNLNLLQNELKFQMSGDVSDETAVSVGKRLGAQSILLGSIKPLGDIYRLQARAIEVETAKIQGMINFNVMQDPILAALTGRTFSGSQSRWLTNQMFGNELWKNKRFYAGLRPGFSVHFYNIDDTSYSGGTVNNGIAFDIAAQFAIQMHSLFAIQLETIFTADSAVITRTEDAVDESGNILYQYEENYIYESQSLIVPLMAKLTFRPDIFSFGLFAGVYFSFPLGQINYSENYSGFNQNGTAFPNPGWIAGANAGIKLGPGTIFLDMRYMADFMKVKVQNQGGAKEIYSLGIAAFSIGYEIGFVNRQK
jgi:TolB-like protein